MFTYDYSKNRYANIYRRIIKDSSIEIIIHKVTYLKRDIFIEKTVAGSDAFMDYTVHRSIDGKRKTLLSRSGIFQGSLIVYGDSIIEKMGHQATLFKWDGQFMLGIPLNCEPYLPYRFERRIDFAIDSDDNIEVAPKSITMRVGEKLFLVRNNTGVSERVLYSGDILHYEDGYFIAIKEGAASIGIIPSGYNHEKAVQIDVIIK